MSKSERLTRADNGRANRFCEQGPEFLRVHRRIVTERRDLRPQARSARPTRRIAWRWDVARRRPPARGLQDLVGHAGDVDELDTARLRDFLLDAIELADGGALLERIAKRAARGSERVVGRGDDDDAARG